MLNRAELVPRVPWAIWTTTVALIVFLSIALIAPRLAFAGDVMSALPPMGGVFFILNIATVGALVASRRPHNPIGWLFCWAGLWWTIGASGVEYGITALQGSEFKLPGAELMAWMAAWVLPTVPGVLGTIVPLMYPNGHLLSRRWRWVAYAALVGVALMCVGVAFYPGELVAGLFVLSRNPLGIDGVLFPVVRAIGFTMVALCGVLAVSSVVLRFRRARGVERLQIKWPALATAVLGLYIIALVLAYVVVGLDTDTPAYKILATASVLASAGLPTAVGIALLRYRLYEIDRLINRTVVYGAFTACIAAIYWVGAALLQGVLRPIAGGSDLAVVGSTLLVAMLFQPLRHRMQAFVDRRFYRKKYDAQRTLAAFGASLQHEIELDALRQDLVGVVHETVQPATVSLWLRKP